jgi:hypothetical protein
LSDRILRLLRCYHFTRDNYRTHAPSSLQNIRPSSDMHTAFA